MVYTSSKGNKYDIDRLGSKNSGYTIRGSSIGFDTRAEAIAYIERRESIGQDPLSWVTDYEKMSKYLINN